MYIVCGKFQIVECDRQGYFCVGFAGICRKINDKKKARKCVEKITVEEKIYTMSLVKGYVVITGWGSAIQVWDPKVEKRRCGV